MNPANWGNRAKRAAALRTCQTHGHEWTDPPDPTNGNRHCRRPGCMAVLPGRPDAWDVDGWIEKLEHEPFDGRRPR